MDIHYVPTVDLFNLIREVDKTYGTSFSRDAVGNFCPDCQGNDSYFTFPLTDTYDLKEWARNGWSKDLDGREKCARLVRDYLKKECKIPDNSILVWVCW